MADLLKKAKDGVIYYSSPSLLSFPKLKHGFFTRVGGVSAGMFESLNFRLNSDDNQENVLKNYDIAAGILGAESQNIATTRQSHTDNIVIVKEARGPGKKVSDRAVDALITNVPGICLTGFFADCQLSLLYDKRRRVCAVVHSGWRGVANKILFKTIDKMTSEFSCRPEDITVAVGPSICRRCFETDSDVPEIMNEAYGELIKEYVYLEGKKWHVDLKNITFSMLLRQGVQPFNIDISNQCTCCSTEKLFWSHRVHGEERGAHAGMIMMI